MTLTRNTLISLVGIAFAAATLYYLFVALETSQLRELSSLVSNREQVMRSHLTLLLENTATEEVVSIVRDCSSETRFDYDRLLGSVATLGRADLIELNSIFSECAYVHPNRQAMMTALLVEEFNYYEELLAAVGSLTVGDDTEVHRQLLWRKAIELQSVRSDLGFELADAQQRIIAALLSGVSATEASLEEERAGAQVLIERTLTTQNEIERVLGDLDDL